MTESHAAFIGEIPANYEKYLGPIIFEEYALDLAHRTSSEGVGAILEIAAGTGLATRRIRDALRQNVRLVATDLNADMLKLAERKFTETENIEFQTANAQELPFADSSFDSVACQFSVMFFPDKQSALNETARVLKPGGKFYFNIWDSFAHNDFIRVANKEIRAVFPHDPPDFFDTPYGFYEIDTLKELLRVAGFGEIAIWVLPRPCTAETARHVALGYVLGTPVRLQIERRNPAALTEVVDRVERVIGEEFGDNPLTSKMQAIVFEARLPA